MGERREQDAGELRQGDALKIDGPLKPAWGIEVMAMGGGLGRACLSLSKGEAYVEVILNAEQRRRLADILSNDGGFR